MFGSRGMGQSKLVIPLLLTAKPCCPCLAMPSQGRYKLQTKYKMRKDTFYFEVIWYSRITVNPITKKGGRHPHWMRIGNIRLPIRAPVLPNIIASDTAIVLKFGALMVKMDENEKFQLFSCFSAHRLCTAVYIKGNATIERSSFSRILLSSKN